MSQDGTRLGGSNGIGDRESRELGPFEGDLGPKERKMAVIRAENEEN